MPLRVKRCCHWSINACANWRTASWRPSPDRAHSTRRHDPLFIDAAHGNYRLQAGSPARDAGTASPPGGLGLFDLDGNPRTFGPAPDIGAFEFGDRIFKDGFDHAIPVVATSCLGAPPTMSA